MELWAIGIKILVFLLVILSGLFIMAGIDGETDVVRWKCWSAAVILWAIIIVIVGITE